MIRFCDAARHADRRPFLLARAAIVKAVRAWFEARGFIEADVGALVPSPGAEVHVAAFEMAKPSGGRYLHTSPEFALKKLLAAGEKNIFFLGKCYRAGEAGPLHAPEFTMLEWYRAGAPYEAAMEDCIAVTKLAAEAAGTRSFSWKGRTCDPFATAEKLTAAEAFQRFTGRPPPEDPDAFAAALVTQIEPHLGAPAPTLLYEYPLSEAALARRCAHDGDVAERFELYCCGVELANGYGELNDPEEQRARLVAAMDEKQKRYGMRWPIDEDFLSALAHMPPASGVALGLDRLIMLAAGAPSLSHVLWNPD